MNAGSSRILVGPANESDPEGTARSVEVPEVEPPRSGIAGSTDGPMTSLRVGHVSGARAKRFHFGGPKGGPDEGKILRTSEGFICPIYYDKRAIEHIAKKAPQLLPELLAELERKRR